MTQAEARNHAAPLAAIAAILLIVLFEVGFVWQFRYHIWDANYIFLEQKREKLTGDSPADDVAILGSSRFLHLRPAAISQAFGGATVTNYSWGYCGIEAYEAMLRGLITAGRAPKLVIVDGMPEIFGYNTAMLTVTQAPKLRTGFAVTAPFWATVRTEIGQKEWKTAWQLIAQRMTPPSTLYRDWVTAALKVLLSTGHLPPLPDGYEETAGAWKRQGWTNFAPPASVATEADFKAFAKETGPYILRKESKKVAWRYERFIRLAAEHDIEILSVAVPNNDLVYAEFNQNGIYDHYSDWLEHLQRKYPNFHAPPPYYMHWPGMLGDAIHVNAAGAARHMNLVLQQIIKLQKAGHDLKTAASASSASPSPR
jgi:hypothetical protein